MRKTVVSQLIPFQKFERPCDDMYIGFNVLGHMIKGSVYRDLQHDKLVNKVLCPTAVEVLFSCLQPFDNCIYDQCI